MNVFSIFLGFGASFGLACAALQAQPSKRSARLIDAGLITLAAALVGGRAGYVLVNWGHFHAAPLEIPQVWLGGFTGLGAAAGGLVGLLLASALTRAPLGALADDLLPLVPPLAVSAWLACMQTGVAYGAAAPGDWWAVPLRDEAGFITPRMPLQPLAAGLTLLLFTLLEAVRPRLSAPG
ncbi:MAG TPA: prolipoprotein diacylglyceryl transferase family protein, partial [Anaerolineaceae bacterium]